jgi:hypothetical protein
LPTLHSSPKWKASNLEALQKELSSIQILNYYTVDIDITPKGCRSGKNLVQIINGKTYMV